MTDSTAGVQPLKRKAIGVSKLRKPYPMYRDSGVTLLGTIPSQWEVTRGRFCMQVNPAVPRLRHLRPDQEVSFVPMESIGELGGMALHATRTVGDCGSGFTEFQDNDVVVAKITPCFENWKGAIASNLRNGVAFGTTELHVLRTRSTLDCRFLFYMTLSAEYRGTGEAEMYGAGGQKRVPPDFNKNFRMPTPPLVEQRAIAAFLDRETGRIDALIAKKERQIELLQEKRQALITHAVSKGLDPNAKMKDSGVEWLGKIPQGWAIARLRDLGTCQNGISIGGEHFGQGTPFVSYGDVYGNPALPKSVAGLVQSTRDDRERYSVRRGDVFFTRTSETIEEIGFASTCLCSIEDAVFAGFLIRFRPYVNALEATYSKYFFRNDSLRAFFVKEMNLVTRASLSQDLLKLMPVLVPPQREQEAIVDYLDRETTRLDALSAKLAFSLALLREYRTALISAVVTGKIDVREATA